MHETERNKWSTQCFEPKTSHVSEKPKETLQEIFQSTYRLISAIGIEMKTTFETLNDPVKKMWI